MPLDRDRLAHLRPLDDGGAIAQCPVCAAAGGDHQGVHLRLFPDGAFACVAHPGDSSHRRQIWAIAGQLSQPDRPWVRVRRRSAPSRAALWLEDIENLKSRIFSDPWLPREMPQSSPAPIPDDPGDQAAAVLRLFPPGDVLWIGFLRDSGKDRNARNFRRASDWLESNLPPAPRICSCTFIPGVIRRCQRTMRSWRFLVVEADVLDFPSQGAILRWLARGSLRLRAIVHSGGRSLHGWFDCPGKRDLAQLRVQLPALGCDPALFNPVQPVRLPGWRRPDNGNIPRLLYLAP